MIFKSLPICLFLVAALTPCIGAASEPTYFDFYGLSSADPDESSSMSGKCFGDAREVYCDIAHVTVRRKIEIDEIAEQWRAMESELEEYLESSEGDALVADLVARVCSAEAFAKPLDEALDGMSSEQRAKFNHPFLGHVKEMAPAFFEACTDKDPERVRYLIADSMRQAFERDTKTCKVTGSVTANEGPYRRAGENSWVHTTRPSGACNAVTTMSFERNDESGYRWTYSQTMTHASRETEFCEGISELVGTQHVWSWRGMGTSNTVRKMGCEYIEF
jgi:hypothetical protein